MFGLKSVKHQQIPLDLGFRSANGREHFLLGPENKAAVGWIDSWPEWPAPVLFISGPSASGKSHLAAVWRDKAQARIVNPENLLVHSAEDIANQSEHLVLDGVDLWLGMREAEEQLFHLYNIMKEEGRSMLLTGRMPPSKIDFAIPDLASRFRAAPVTTIDAPGDMLLGSVLIKLFSDRQLTVNNEVVKYILPRMERSFGAARELVERADKMALANKQKISVPLMRKVLSDMME